MLLHSIITKSQGLVLMVHQDNQDSSFTSTNSPSCYVLLLGVPSEYIIDDLMLFTAAYASEILQMELLPCTDTLYQFALLTFSSPETIPSFISLYNYQHFPLNGTFEQLCIALPLHAVIANTKVDTELVAALPAYKEIPQCPYCIGRINEHVTGIPGSNKSLPVILSASSRKRCRVCDLLYSHMSGGEVPCTSCHLLGNIWVCLLCGNCGCGYYSRQHAKEHYDASSHGLGIELATGRIWDYTLDNFVHAANSDLRYLMFEAAMSSGATPQRHSGDKSQEAIEQQERLADEQLLDPITRAKLQNLSAEYETVILNQLRDQELHYEKIMARETLQGLNLVPPRGSVEAVEGAEVSAVTLEEMQDMEALKLEISVLEQESALLQYKVREAEKMARDVKKENDFLIKEQKRLKEETASITRQAEEKLIDTQQLLEDMKQQIKDLKFYSKTKHTMESTEMKDGNLVIVNSKAEETKSSTPSKDARRHSRGKSKK